MSLRAMLGPEMSEDMSKSLDLRFSVSPSATETSASRLGAVAVVQGYSKSYLPKSEVHLHL